MSQKCEASYAVMLFPSQIFSSGNLSRALRKNMNLQAFTLHQAHTRQLQGCHQTMNNHNDSSAITSSADKQTEATMMYNKSDSINLNPATYNRLFMADTSQVYCSRSLLANDEVEDTRVTNSLLESAASTYRPARNNAKNRRPNTIIAREADDDDNDDDARRRADAALRGSVSSTSTEGSSSSSRRRSSAASSASPGGGGGGGATLRRKCQPLHKCATVNQSVSSIMRPSRYSMNSSTHSISNEQLLTDNSVTTTTATANKAPRRRVSRRSSEGGLPSQSMHSYFLRGSSSSSIIGGNKKPQKREDSLNRSLSSAIDDPWVASGVDFSSSVEVYVFRK